MTVPNNPPGPPFDPSAPEQVGELLSSPEMAKAAESEEFKRFLDHVPIALLIAKERDGIVYANLAFETLTGRSAADAEGRSWSLLDNFVHEDDGGRTLGQAVTQDEDFVGTFRAEVPEDRCVLVQAYAGVIEDDSGVESYRIAALVDVTDRERAQRDAFEKQIRDKDLLLKELQHRVKNNLQLVTALIRLEGRAAQRGDNVDLERLASRVDTLALLYQALSTDHWGPVVDLAPYLSEIASASVRAHGGTGIALDLKVSYCPVSLNVAMPAGLLVNELLTNSFKYAFEGRDKGTIGIACACEDGEHHQIVYADDGVGMADGASWPAAGKLGALIVQTLRENSKDLKVETMSQPGKGVQVTIDFTYRSPMHKAS